MILNPLRFEKLEILYKVLFDMKNDLNDLKKLTLEINDHLVDLFLKADLILVDFKLEFGKNSGKIYLDSYHACWLILSSFQNL